MAKLTTFEENLAHLEKLIAEVKEATREAHIATKELKATEKAIRKLIQDEGRSIVGEEIERVATEQLTSFGNQVHDHITKSAQKVNDEFDKLRKQFFGEDLHLKTELEKVAIVNQATLIFKEKGLM